MNPEIEYKSRYFGDPNAKASFEQYAMDVFGLDFSRWKEKGLWSDRYVPFSAFVDDRCVASICVYSCRLTINRKRVKGAQLLTVGTLPEYRGRGIQRKIWERVSEWCLREHKFIFLFTGDTAAGFYESLGLARREEFFDVFEVRRSDTDTVVDYKKLNMDDENDYQIAYRLAHNRSVVSNTVGFHNPNLLLFMLLYPFREWSYYVRNLDCIVIAERKDDSLRVHDVIGVTMPAFKEIEPLLREFQRERIEFLFCTDRLGLMKTYKQPFNESLLFVSSGFNVSEKMIFPASIRA